MLEIRRNRSSKPYENEFFRIFAKKLAEKFKGLGISGVLLGSPKCLKRNDLQIDALLICETAIVIIDFKNYSGDICLPDSNQFETGDWEHVRNPHKTTIVKGGAQGKNPFRQVMDQREKFNSLVEEFVRKELLPSEHVEPDNTFAIVCFQQKVNLLNKVPSRVKRLFNVADPTSIVDVVEAAVFVDPNEWKGRINGYKLSGNVFALVKKIFRADKYDPFEDNSLFAEFESIDFQDESSVEEQIESEFLEHVAIIDEFLNGDSHVLKIEADSASNRIGFTQRVVSEYLRRKGIDDSDPGIESGVCYLAPSNKYVNQIINQNGPTSIRSLYGKLYDYDNTDIELLNNNINERETFPLVENKDSDGMLYVIFHAHLVYDFAPNPEDLIRFGTGNQCDDIFTFINPQGKNSKIILVDDPYFYGFRSNTLASDISLQTANLQYLTLCLKSRPVELNEKSIVALISNFEKSKFNNFSFQKNENVSCLYGDEFRNKLKALIYTGQINKSKILMRDPGDTVGVNKFIRKTKGITELTLQPGDVIWLKNKASVPEEETDPFSVPKFVQSGDIAEVLSVVERSTYSSKKYNWKPIEVSKIKIRLMDHDSDRELYVATYPTSENFNLKEQKKHIQIRCREIIDDYLSAENIRYEDILRPEELPIFLSQRDAIPIQTSLDQSEEKIVAESLQKLETKWKINKRKQKFAEAALLRDANSEYFKLTQLVQFEFAWALCLKSVYGYKFPECFLVKYDTPTKSPQRVHQFIYSALGVSEKLFTHEFAGVNPWISIEPINNAKEKAVLEVDTKYLFEPDDSDLSEYEEDIKSRFFGGDSSNHLIKICGELLNRIENKTEYQLERIGHHPYLEKYYFIAGPKPFLLELYYDKNFKVKTPATPKQGEIWDILLTQEKAEKEPYVFYPDECWQSRELKKLQDELLEKNTFIYDFKHGEWHYLVYVKSGIGEGVFKLFYNKNGFFSSMEMIAYSEFNPFPIINESIEHLKHFYGI